MRPSTIEKGSLWIERTAWVAGVALLCLYGGVRLWAEESRAQAVEEFRAVTAAPKVGPADTSLWSRERVDAYAQAVAHGPDLEAAYIGLARALIEDDRYERARNVLHEFLDRFPRSSRRGSAEQALEELRFLGPGKPG